MAKRIELNVNGKAHTVEVEPDMPLLYALQILSPIALFGLLVMTGWNLWTACQEKRGWFALIWAVLLILAAILLLWMAFAFQMFGFGTHY